MKKRLSEVLIVLLSLVTVLSMASCSVNVKPVERTEEEAAVVGKIGNEDIYYDEYRYIVMNSKADLEDKYGKGIWDSPETAAAHKEELESMVYSSLCNSYHAVASMADFYYAGGSSAMFNEDAILKAVKESVNETAEECGSKKEYLKALGENYLTDALFRYYLTAEECATELTYILSTDLGEICGTSDEYLEFMHSADFVRTNHVYIKGISEENRALAESLRMNLIASSDPESEIIIMKSKYDSDFTLTTTHGAYFARYTSDYGDAYELAAFDLGVGHISEVVETDSGYYVIIRLPVEDEWINANFDDFANDIRGSQFNVILNEYQEKLVFTPNDYCKTLNILEIK